LTDPELIKRNQANGWDDLTAVQKAFAYSFLVTYDHRNAAVEAGQDPSQGLKMLRHPLTAAFINAEQQHQATVGYITKEYVMVQYMNLMPMLMGEVAVPLGADKDGEQVIARKFDAANMKGVLSEMSKFIEEYSGDQDTPVNNITFHVVEAKNP
jgi:hypothetical protein|tara:strand:+ start:328 stop:789 length:462 start_codon:yes stop_codon:yes gene_type:complete